MPTTEAQWLQDLLAQAAEPLFLRLHADLAVAVVDDLVRASSDLLLGDASATEVDARRLQGIAVAAIATAEDLRGRRSGREAGLADLHRQLERTDDRQQRDLQLLEFLRQLAGRAGIDRRDRRALRRWLDASVADERVAELGAADAVREECLVHIVGVLLANVCRVARGAVASRMLERSRFFAFAISSLDPALDWRVSRAVAQACERIATAIGPDQWLATFSLDCYAALRELAGQDGAPLWSRVAAWRAWRACRQDPWLEAVEDHLQQQADRLDESLFLRRCLVEDLAACDDARVPALLQRTVLGPERSDHVRIHALLSLGHHGHTALAPVLDSVIGYHTHRPDRCSALQVAALLALCERWLADAEDPAAHEWLISRWEWIARFAIDTPVLRALLERTPGALEGLSPPTDGFTVTSKRVLAGCYRLRMRSDLPLHLRRWSSECIERIIVPRLPAGHELMRSLASALATLRRGARLTLLLPAEHAGDADLVGRVCALLTQDDLGCSARLDGRQLLLQRGERFRPRLWRLLHELRHPAPDKRQGWHHTVGRSWAGPLRAHPLLCGEQSPTRVPGEPLVIESEGQWRRHLPLIDDCLDACRWNETLRLYSAHGITRVRPPAGRGERWRARLRLVWRYADYAALRDRGDGERGLRAQHAFLAALRELGLGIDFRAWPPPAPELSTHAHDEHLHEVFQPPAAPPDAQAVLQEAAS